MKIKLLRHVDTPCYARSGDAGFDLVCAINEPIKLYPGEKQLIPSGIAVEIPPQHFGMLVPRSSLGKKGLALANTVGIIDSSYRGEVQAYIVNQSQDPVTIEPLERLVQMVIVPFHTAIMEPVFELSETERGDGGFGSSGRK